jgi:DNA-binding NarL/FixJ family response regulator
MAEGLTNAGTAERLRMSVSAVEKHVASIFGKLGIAEAAGYSRRVLAILRYLGS